MRRLRRAHQRDAEKRKKLRNRAIAAGTAAAITLGTGVSLRKALAAYTPDPHELPVSQDADADLLANLEELAIGYNVFDPDQNRNEIPDGIELAKRCLADVNDLPEWCPASDEPEPNEPYKMICAAAYGMETCAVCGKDDIVMIVWEVVNPQNGAHVQFTDMALHYLEHGSFSYHSLSGWSGKGRVDVPALVGALGLPYEPDKHQLPVPKDADTDLLADPEELAIGYQPFDPDQNRNEIPDGLELAKRCKLAIDQLPEFVYEAPPGIQEPHKIIYLLDGVGTCEICGFQAYMDYWDIVNPRLGLTISVSILDAHYMEHGSFSYQGGGKADVARLLRALELRFPYDPNEHQLSLDYVVNGVGQLAPDANDHDGDLLADSEELAGGHNLYNPDQDNDLTPDGIEFATQCHEVIDALPIYDPKGGEPEPNEPYKVSYFLKGPERCEICGASVNMGWWQVVNPKLHRSMDIYDITCHYMSHGSFSYSGLQPTTPHEPFHNGRVKIEFLAEILEMPQRCGDLGTIYLPTDYNRDCAEDFRDFASFGDKWLASTEPD